MTASVVTMSSSPTQVKALTSASDVEAWHVESDVVPLIAASFIFDGGSAHDPAGKPGVAQMLASLLDEGAGDYDSDAFHERLAARAIKLSFNACNDALHGSLKTLAKHVDEAFELLRLALAEPRFDQDSIERVRAQTIAGLKWQQNDPNVMAARRLFEEGFAGHPYGRPTSGTPESVAAITRNDLIAMHKTIIARGRVTIAVVGAIRRDYLSMLLDKVFGSLPPSKALSIIEPASLQKIGSRFVVDLDVPQSAICFGMKGIARRDPGFIPAYVLNHILGGGAFTSRLFREVREKRGLAYRVSTSLASYRSASMTCGETATKNERGVEALGVIADEMAKLTSEGPSDEELQKAKDYLIGSHALNFGTSKMIADTLAQIAFDDLGIDYIARRNGLVAAVTQADIRMAAERIIGDSRMLTVIAGRPTGL